MEVIEGSASKRKWAKQRRRAQDQKKRNDRLRAHARKHVRPRCYLAMDERPEEVEWKIEGSLLKTSKAQILTWICASGTRDRKKRNEKLRGLT